MPNQTEIFDRIGLDTANIKTLGDGSLMVKARLSRAGLQYYGAPRFDSLTPVMRHAKDWLSPETVSQLAGLPITIRHAAMVDEDNVGELSVGVVGTDVHVDDAEYTAARIVVQGRKAKTLLLSGQMTELSVGYYAEFRREPGVHDGVPYEWVMYPVRMNHVALLERGRAGGAKVLLDTAENGLHRLVEQSPTIVAGDAPMSDTNAPAVTPAGQGWLEVVVDGENHKVRQGPADLIVRLAKERDIAVADAAAAKVEAGEAKGKIAGLESEVQKLKDAAPDKDALRAEVKDEVSRRYILEADCKSVGVEVADEKDDVTLRREAIALIDSDIKLEHMADTEIGGLYSYLMGKSKGASKATKSLLATIDGIAADGDKAPAMTPGDLALVSALGTKPATK